MKFSWDIRIFSTTWLFANALFSQLHDFLLIYETNCTKPPYVSGSQSQPTSFSVALHGPTDL